MDLHQRFDSIKTTVLSVVLTDPAKLVPAFEYVTKEICISKFYLMHYLYILHLMLHVAF